MKHAWSFAQLCAVVIALGSPCSGSDLCATVMDLARLPLPSAFLNVTNLNTGKAYLIRSDKAGVACFSGLPEGLYSVDASLTGFLHVKYYPVRVTAAGKQNLSFWLPFGETTEGGFGSESTLTGTLLDNGVPVEAAEICITSALGSSRLCTVTNDLGEYAIVSQAGVYRVEIRMRGGRLYESKVDLSTPGIYRNQLSMDRKP